MICRYLLAPSRLIRYRSFDYSKSTCGLIGAVSPCLFAHPIRRAGRSMAGVLGIPRACGLASLSPLIRYGRRGDDVPGVLICGRYRWQAEVFHIRGSFISIRFRSRSPTPFRPALRLSDTRNGTGAYLSSLVPLSAVSRSCRWCMRR